MLQIPPPTANAMKAQVRPACLSVPVDQVHQLEALETGDTMYTQICSRAADDGDSYSSTRTACQSLETSPMPTHSPT